MPIDCEYARIDGTYVSTNLCSLRSVTYHQSLNSSNLLYHNSLNFICLNETTMRVLISNDTVCNSIEHSYIATNNMFPNWLFPGNNSDFNCNLMSKDYCNRINVSIFTNFYKITHTHTNKTHTHNTTHKK